MRPYKREAQQMTVSSVISDKLLAWRAKNAEMARVSVHLSEQAGVHKAVVLTKKQAIRESAHQIRERRYLKYSPSDRKILIRARWNRLRLTAERLCAM